MLQGGWKFPLMTFCSFVCFFAAADDIDCVVSCALTQVAVHTDI